MDAYLIRYLYVPCLCYFPILLYEVSMIIVAQLLSEEHEDSRYRLHTATDKGLYQIFNQSTSFNDFWYSTNFKKMLDKDRTEYGFKLILE